jgi:hypothetical protein
MNESWDAIILIRSTHSSQIFLGTNLGKPTGFYLWESPQGPSPYANYTGLLISDENWGVNTWQNEI